MLLVLSAACATEEEVYWIEFKVFEDRHMFFTNSKAHEKRLEEKVEINTLEFKARFDESCLYDTAGFGNDVYDQNKLFGITLNGTDPLKGSLMFGWNHIDSGKINITGFYNRVNGTHMYVNPVPSLFGLENMVEIYPQTENQFKIQFIDTVKWYVNDKLIFAVDKSEIGEPNDLQFYTLPWFGGQQPAPNDMTIFVHLPF